MPLILTVHILRLGKIISILLKWLDWGLISTTTSTSGSKAQRISLPIAACTFNEYLPNEVLYRKKEAFSDGVSGNERSWFQIIAEKLECVDIPSFNLNNKYLPPITKEQMYYRYIFEQEYHKREDIIPYFWMPKWTNTTDPSARTL